MLNAGRTPLQDAEQFIDERDERLAAYRMYAEHPEATDKDRDNAAAAIALLEPIK